MFNNMFNEDNRPARFNNRQYNKPAKDTYEDFIYDVLHQFNLEQIKSHACDSIFEMKQERFISIQEFIDEMLIALRTIYDAKISIDEKDIIELTFSPKCSFKIKITES